MLFMDESWFQLYQADGRQSDWRHVGEQFADVNVVNSILHGGGWGYGMGRHELETKNTMH